MATRVTSGVFILTDYTQAQEDTLAAQLAGASAGSSVIFNTDISPAPGIARIWNGSAFENIPPILNVVVPLATATLQGGIPAFGDPLEVMRVNAAGNALEFVAMAGGGDMVINDAQTVTGAKTFNDTKFLLRNVADTFNGSFVNINTADRVYTLKDANGTLAFTSDITGTNSGTNTGDQTSIVGISGTFAQFNTAVSDADLARTDAGNTFTGSSTTSGWVNTSPKIVTGIEPDTDDGAALGTTTKQFSDLFLATGGVINWNNGNATLTHSAGALAFNAVPVTIPRTPTIASTSTSVTFSSTHYGAIFLWSPGGTATATLPANGAAAGSWFEVLLLTNQTVTISAATADTLITFNDTAADSVAFSTNGSKIGGCIRFVSNGTVWVAFNLSNNTMTVAT